MNFEKILGFKLDTNQFTSKTLETKSEARFYIDKVVGLYGEEILKFMFLTDDKRFTSFKKDGVSLYSILN